MSELIKRLVYLRDQKNANHEAIVQVKIPAHLREELFKALDADSFTVKDLFTTAIHQYLEERGRIK